MAQRTEGSASAADRQKPGQPGPSFYNTVAWMLLLLLRWPLGPVFTFRFQIPERIRVVRLDQVSATLSLLGSPAPISSVLSPLFFSLSFFPPSLLSPCLLYSRLASSSLK